MQAPWQACEQDRGAGIDINKDESRCRAEVLSCALQGKYINDPEVLREAAHAAGVEGYEKVLSDPMHAMDQASTFSIALHRDCYGYPCPVTYISC